MRQARMWAPAVIFGLGSILILGVDRQQHLELVGDLDAAVPSELFGLVAQDLPMSQAEIDVAGMDTYLLRAYGSPSFAQATDPATEPAPTSSPDSDAGATPAPEPGASPATAAAVPPFSLYVGFYGSQAQGRTIHSPKNCLPGSGWEALNAREARVVAGGEEVPVNRYLLQRGDERVLVLYWYQGRGRVQANEYRVKLDLLKDSALHNRSDEALVRIVVPIESSEEQAFQAAAEIAARVIPAVYTALPS